MTRDELIDEAVDKIYADVMFDPPEVIKSKIRIRVVDLVASLEGDDVED